MKVGDYVRFNDRDWTEIGQITGFVEDSHLKIVKCRDGYYDLDNFIKYGSIIDVIEVGDYVNGMEVTHIGGTRWDDNDLHCYCEHNGNENWKQVMIPAKDIKSIVTKEQFESMEYKVEEWWNIKVIDLLNKIAKGDKELKDKNEIMINTYLHTHYVPECLNDEVEIIEENKKIEKIDMFDYFTGYDFGGTNDDLLMHLERNFSIINDTLNKVIDKLNEVE